MKKIIAIIFSLMVITSIISCSKTTTDDTKTKEKTKTTSERVKQKSNVEKLYNLKNSTDQITITDINKHKFLVKSYGLYIQDTKDPILALSFTSLNTGQVHSPAMPIIDYEVKNYGDFDTGYSNIAIRDQKTKYIHFPTTIEKNENAYGYVGLGTSDYSSNFDKNETKFVFIKYSLIKQSSGNIEVLIGNKYKLNSKIYDQSFNQKELINLTDKKDKLTSTITSLEIKSNYIELLIKSTNKTNKTVEIQSSSLAGYAASNLYIYDKDSEKLYPPANKIDDKTSFIEQDYTYKLKPKESTVTTIIFNKFTDKSKNVDIFSPESGFARNIKLTIDPTYQDTSKKATIPIGSPISYTTLDIKKINDSQYLSLIGGVYKIYLKNDVLFETGKFDLSSKSSESLKTVASIINSLDKTSISIVGYTDSDGDTNSNLDLSQKRANAVNDSLKKLISDYSNHKVSISGKGESNPLNSNSTDEEKKANRRVEITITPID